MKLVILCTFLVLVASDYPANDEAPDSYGTSTAEPTQNEKEQNSPSKPTSPEIPTDFPNFIQGFFPFSQLYYPNSYGQYGFPPQYHLNYPSQPLTTFSTPAQNTFPPFLEFLPNPSSILPPIFGNGNGPLPTPPIFSGSTNPLPNPTQIFPPSFIKPPSLPFSPQVSSLSGFRYPFCYNPYTQKYSCGKNQFNIAFPSTTLFSNTFLSKKQTTKIPESYGISTPDPIKGGFTSSNSLVGASYPYEYTASEKPGLSSFKTQE